MVAIEIKFFVGAVGTDGVEEICKFWASGRFIDFGEAGTKNFNGQIIVEIQKPAAFIGIIRRQDVLQDLVDSLFDLFLLLVKFDVEFDILVANTIAQVVIFGIRGVVTPDQVMLSGVLINFAFGHIDEWAMNLRIIQRDEAAPTSTANEINDDGFDEVILVMRSVNFAVIFLTNFV